jgi:hypothetical protein
MSGIMSFMRERERSCGLIQSQLEVAFHSLSSALFVVIFQNMHSLIFTPPEKTIQMLIDGQRRVREREKREEGVGEDRHDEEENLDLVASLSLSPLSPSLLSLSVSLLSSSAAVNFTLFS